MFFLSSRSLFLEGSFDHWNGNQRGHFEKKNDRKIASNIPNPDSHKI